MMMPRQKTSHVNCKIELKDYQLKLLRDIIGKRCPELSHRLQSIDINALSFADRQSLIDALSAEFAASGVGKDWEPTQQGLEIEQLIDAVNRPNLEKPPENAAPQR